MFRKLIVASAAVLIAASTICPTTDAAILRGAVDCGPPEAVTQGIATYSSTKMGATVRFACAKGTSMIGSASSTCNKSGRWSQASPTCRTIYLKKNDNSYKNNDTGYVMRTG